jgi:hypothetical protein
MIKFLGAIFLLLVSIAPGLAQQGVASAASGGARLVRPHDVEGDAAKARAEAEKLYGRVDRAARRAVQSMCVECMGAKYNRPASKSPFVMPDEVLNLEEPSSMEEEPQLGTEP